MENDTFGKSLIDTDAQVIIIVNIIYVVMVGTKQPHFIISHDRKLLDVCMYRRSIILLINSGHI